MSRQENVLYAITAADDSSKTAAFVHRQTGSQAILSQAKALVKTAGSLGESFDHAVEAILSCKGRIVVSGMGKSGLVGRKMVGTFSSTGTPSFFLHPAEAFHGDLGMLKESDVVILISYGGETEEIVKLIPSLKSFGNFIICMTGNQTSTLARHGNVCLDISVEREVCPNNLAPTTSTIATMALGDALAVALIKARSFQSMDFARYHPGGSLGRQLLSRVKDAMRCNLPFVSEDTPFHECLLTMSDARMGLAIVIDGTRLAGIVTDGDLRRALITDRNMTQQPVKAFMKRHPHTVSPNTRLSEAEMYMREHRIRALIVVDDNTGNVVGVVEIFD